MHRIHRPWCQSLESKGLLRALSQTFRPHTATILLDSPEAVEFFAQHSPAVREMKPINGKPSLYECENFTCRAPVTPP